MAVARRPLLTATAAATLLAALWFVPSANATDRPTPATGARSQPATTVTDTAPGPRLADTGTGIGTRPYLIGGMAFLGIGAALVSHSVRRPDTLLV
ncbi:hypothetical protein ACIODX_08275 [Streptomyces sp. NPDC088190]|uniref:hypothetical protein n=1 Tax=unclassified Streptomyces TaxID=2593676 RepID=UPI002E790911|nr:hypothetical protein [Streptomyces sp. JV190]MEE1844492.1 hypothetical protein [Streptomyces sp. JV190]